MSKYTNGPATGYRGMQQTGPISPYAFTSTPQIVNSNSPRPFATTHPARTSSASEVPQASRGGVASAIAAQRQTSSSSIPTAASTMPLQDKAPMLTLSLPASGSLMSMNTTSNPKPSPDRYRKNVHRADSSDNGISRGHTGSGSAMPSGSGMAAVGQLYSHPAQSTSTPILDSYRGTTYAAAAGSQPRKSGPDDMAISRPQNNDLAARYRRRSLVNIETAGLNHNGEPNDKASPHPNAFIQPQQHPAPIRSQQPTSSHAHTTSVDSVSSSRSARSSRPNSAQNNVQSVQIPMQANNKPKQDARLGNATSRQTEPIKRNPSPLSRPVDLGREGNDTAPSSANAYQASAGTATEQLTAVSQKDAKSSKSKLRRAFSFGSAAELRKATAHHNLERTAAVTTTTPNKRSSKYEDELEPEQARIAEKQEAAGLGESIYSGQGRFFTGSTDNLSVSSTASSASIMLRKMGKGMKKGTRSLVGLFRPKSVVGVPAADGPVNQASMAQVSMVTAEAEPQKVNVNADPHDHAGGGTGFPRLERNSIDTKLSVDSGARSSETRSRRSIVGGEKERAEVLAAVKKGILKRNESGQPSPKLRAMDSKPSDFHLPQIPHMSDSPRSSAPSTPGDEPPRSGHRRTDSITIESNDHEDYFDSMNRFASLDSKTDEPLTPRAVARNISFSPRIQFHDTWTGTEYDRRGEIATCNRLTPMLAQQIKEELNTFKMVSIRTLSLNCERLTASAGDGSSRVFEGLHTLLLIASNSASKYDYATTVAASYTKDAT